VDVTHRDRWRSSALGKYAVQIARAGAEEDGSLHARSPLSRPSQRYVVYSLNALASQTTTPRYGDCRLSVRVSLDRARFHVGSMA
jgi:hypothetical protein